ncbi:MAG: bluetail domain-containing putative surface protein [Methylovulum sp.]|nr:bluetail domain-containing putative surface protein [Methylovulum sp.]
MSEKVFEANGAATFTFHEETFLAMNDNIAGYLATTDAIVKITGISGELSDLVIV